MTVKARDRRCKVDGPKRESTFTSCPIDQKGEGCNLMARATPPRPPGNGWRLIAVADDGKIRRAHWTRLV